MKALIDVMLGIDIEVSPEHPENASSPIHVTLLEIVTDVRLEQFRKAPLPIDSMP